jgi:hypothetical protein
MCRSPPPPAVAFHRPSANAPAAHAARPSSPRSGSPPCGRTLPNAQSGQARGRPSATPCPPSSRARASGLAGAARALRPRPRLRRAVFFPLGAAAARAYAPNAQSGPSASGWAVAAQTLLRTALDGAAYSAICQGVRPTGDPAAKLAAFTTPPVFIKGTVVPCCVTCTETPAIEIVALRSAPGLAATTRLTDARRAPQEWIPACTRCRCLPVREAADRACIRANASGPLAR